MKCATDGERFCQVSLCGSQPSLFSKAHRKRASASTAMPAASKLNVSSTITPEIWSNIFHIATFIPGEWDKVDSRGKIRIYASSYPQLEAYHSVLPLRRSIVEVCRLWHKIGTNLLYASFHYKCPNPEEPSYRLAAFAHVLVACPHLGRLVKRLTVWWSPTITDNELIIRHCPNAIILSASRVNSRYPGSPWIRSLPESIRTLEAGVNGVETADLMRILYSLPNLESLRLWDFGDAGCSSQYPRLRFPALRQLTLEFDVWNPKPIKSWVPILSNLDAPRLTAFRTNMGRLGSAVSSFPRDIWERLTYLGACWKGYRYIKSTYLLNLQHLYLHVEENQTLPKLRQHFPFHQLEILTLSLVHMRLVDVTEWKTYFQQLLAFPLDTQMMPSLRVLELDWRIGGLEAFVKCQASRKDVLSRFLISLGSLAVQLEKRGVRCLEVQEGDVYHTPTLIQDVVAACKKQLL